LRAVMTRSAASTRMMAKSQKVMSGPFMG
jgi:hypothetical protein